MLNKRNVAKYYPETTETPKGHLNQTRKTVQSTKPNSKPFEKTDASTLWGNKARDVYNKVYEVCNTVFSYQTGQFPTRSQQGNKYIMVMVETDSNAIMVETIEYHSYAELTRAYHAMMLRLK